MPAALKRTVEEAGYSDAAAEWVALPGGRSNRAWHVGAFVVKLYGPGRGNPLFRNDPQAEASALRHLSGQGIAPELIGALDTEDGPCLVYRHSAGIPWDRDTPRAARLLQRLHRLAPPTDLPLRAGGSASLAAKAEAILDTCPPGADRDRVAASRPDLPPCPPAGEARFLHGDPVPGNILSGPGGLVLIDWQCPARGDAAEDLALFLSPAMQVLYRGTALNEPEIRDFLSAYDDKETVARYRALAPLYHWRMAAYCLWRSGGRAGPDRDAMLAELAALAG